MKILNITVKAEDGDVRLDRWIKRYYPHITQGVIQKLCRTGQIRVDKKRVRASVHLIQGNTVRLPIDKNNEKRCRQIFEVDQSMLNEVKNWIIYEDKDLFVFNKPSGIAVQGGSTIKLHIDGILDVLKDKNGYRPTLVHRLDKDTSGILLIARHPASAAKLAAAFRSRDVKKTYWAITTGRPNPLSGCINLPLLKIERPNESYVVIAEKNKDAKKAVTKYEVKDYAARKLAWVELYPITGRMHQLRAHCAAINCPILGDKKYNQNITSLDGFSDLLHLHARFLSIPHPQRGILQIEADLPSHMKATFKSLGFDLTSKNLVNLIIK